MPCASVSPPGAAPPRLVSISFSPSAPLDNSGTAFTLPPEGRTRFGTLGESAHKTKPSVSLLKGGIPAAPSGTATLLRLSPSHRFYPKQLLIRSPSSGTPGFHGLTGGVYKVRERIHRAMADARLLAIPTSWSRVADSNPNWDGLSWIGSTSRLCDPLYPPL